MPDLPGQAQEQNKQLRCGKGVFLKSGSPWFFWDEIIGLFESFHRLTG